ncbi:MAG: low temperature requirement protein A [Candidatus Kariarchaeaceae archaeon]
MALINPSPPDQPAHFSELFFDIIFVFSIVQTVELLHGHFDLLTVYKAAIIFWIVWWLWTQFTWGVNGVDTRDDMPKLIIMLVTGISFFMATAIPNAFGEKGIVFALAYALARVVGLLMVLNVSGHYPVEAQKSVKQFSFLSFVSTAIVIVGGIVPVPWRYVLWGLVIVFDVVTTFIAGGDQWLVFPEHFTERHGLFMIIALGETLIINAAGLTASIDDINFLAIAIAAVGVTLGLWWNYFGHAKDKMTEVMEEAGPARDGMMARDAYSLLHFPIFFGVIAYASALEDVVHHPFDALNGEIRMAFAVGSILFLSGIAVVIYRLTRKVLVHRIILPIIGAGLILLLPEIMPITVLLVIFVQVVIIAIIEEKMDFFAEGHDHH